MIYKLIEAGEILFCKNKIAGCMPLAGRDNGL